MDEIQETQIDYDVIKKLELSDIFPKTILYPDQKIDNINLEQDKYTNQEKEKQLKFSPPVKIQFSSEKPIVWDIAIVDNMIICCGGKFIKVYSKTDICILKSKEPIHTFVDSNPNEDFYTIALTEVVFNSRKVKYLAGGGLGSIIRILDITNLKEQSKLIGHRNEIYDLKFHPLESDLLLSASKDFSIRLWNIITGIQICIFGGPEGHSAEVLSIDFHLSGNYFASSGIDGFVKIWDIETAVKEKIKLSRITPKNNFKTLIRARSIFSCNSIHDNYVDCVRFNGNLLLSKSVDGIIKEYLPCFDPEDDLHFLTNTYFFELTQQIWFLKYTLDYNFNYLAVGNNLGVVTIFRINDEKNEDNYNYEKKIYATLQSEKETLVRQVAFHRDLEFIAWATDDSSIYICDIIK
jgi:polycomb protein EED